LNSMVSVLLCTSRFVGICELRLRIPAVGTAHLPGVGCTVANSVPFMISFRWLS